MSAAPSGPGLESAQQAYQEGNYEASRAACERFLAANPGDARGHYLRGLSVLKGGLGLREAALAFRDAGRADPKQYGAIQNAVSCLAEGVRRGEPTFEARAAKEPECAGEPVSIAVCSIDAARLSAMQANFTAHLGDREHEFVVIHDARSLAEGYTRALGRARHDFIVFCHDDLEWISPWPFDALERALGHHDLVGLAGSRLASGPAVNWAGHPHIHGWVSYPAPAPGPGFDAAPISLECGVLGGMQALDGVLLATRKSVVERVGFDASAFDGFHFYDLDFTLRAQRAGYRLAVTTEALAVHASLGTFGEDWQRYRAQFTAKHPGLSAPKGDHHAYGARLADRAQLLEFHRQLRALAEAP